MGTLASALRPIAEDLADAPRVYVDANVPAGVVAAMRRELRWDVLFVMEHDDLRRAPDREHFRRALDFGRTLITLDRDFLDDSRFPPERSPGVVVCSAPDENGLLRELTQLDRDTFRADGAGAAAAGRTQDRHDAGRRRMNGRVFLTGASLVLPDRIAAGRTAGHRRRPHRGLGGEAGRRLVRPMCGSNCPATSSCRDSSTCTSTASRATTRWTARDALAAMAATLPRHGVSSFCPTSVACSPDDARRVSRRASASLRAGRRPVDARVVGAHVESNFISPAFRRRAAGRVPARAGRRSARAGRQLKAISVRLTFCT